MGLQKKKNVIILSMCIVLCFTLYQLYFFFTITSETGNGSKIDVLYHENIRDFVHVRSEKDKYINDNGLIRGVLYSYFKDYRPNSKNEYKCRNSDQRISFDQVNDDYCDCDDETDEPSTSACPGGRFYCVAQLQKKYSIQSIPSSKVNDGICDCCDGSDEWLHDKQTKLLSQSSKQHYRHFVDKCPNICM